MMVPILSVPEDVYKRQVYDFGKKIEDSLKERFEEFDRVAEYNQMKVLLAMQKNRVSEECFGASSGYGYNDFGRDTLEKEMCIRDRYKQKHKRGKKLS